MKNETIYMVCANCNKSIKVTRTSDIPHNAEYGYCNYCPSCEDDMDDYYDEWFYDVDGKRI